MFWAGDGIQAWLQLLLHLLRSKDSDVLVLDEPDLYLHADLQRRLTRLLESREAQTITATHSPEMLGEASPESLIWVDKSRRRGVRPPDDAAIGELARTIGSQFNLRLAKALKARVVLFVEGDDMKIIRDIAKIAGLTRFANEIGLAIVPLGGFSRWGDVTPFQWLNDHFLGGSVSGYVVLDRDYRSDSETRQVRDSLRAAGVNVHVWKHKELESYLLVPSTLARVSGASPDWTTQHLRAIADGMEHSVGARMIVERQQRGRRDRAVQIAEAASRDFAAAWEDEQGRCLLCPAKDVLSALNRDLQTAGHRPVSARTLAKRMRRDEIAPEMLNLLSRIEEELATPAHR